jgi:hypothetical protein
MEQASGCKRDGRDKQRSEILTGVQVVSGGLFFAVAAWGIADAILNYQPEVALPGTTPPPAPRAAVSRGLRLQLAPVVDGSTLGAGLAFRF